MLPLPFLTGPAATFLVLALATAAPSAPACEGVRGDIDARAQRLGLDWHGFKVTGDGSIQGALKGNLRLEVRRKGRRGLTTELAIKLTAATARGPVLMEGRAFAAREQANDPLASVRGWLDVSREDGAVGRFRVEGTADTERRAIAVRYSGELCSTAEELHPAGLEIRP